VAGGTTVENVNVMTQLAIGWSVKKTLLGKTIYNEVGEKVGKVDDLIISPERDVTYIIVGAGGFIGIGRHDVAIPVNQIKNQAGKLVMAGATKDMIKAMPQFTYAADTAERDQFVATAEANIKAGKAKVAELEKMGGLAATDVKARIDQQIAALQGDVKAAESKLAEMKKATAVRWKEFEASVSTATARVRKSIEAATD
jgi:sporulation protein YlmC with PRC-barrel domain